MRGWKLTTISIAIGGVLLWFFVFRSSPLETFEKQMQSHVKVLNEYRHARLKPYISDQLADRLHQNGTDLARAVLFAQRRDLDRRIQYRFEGTTLFQEGDYAEARFLRSGSGGNFDPSRPFHIPWVRQDGEWRVASGFRDGRAWDYPRY
jgi:hypothetical protein